MPVLISGVLKDGTGTPVQNCTIQLKACRTSTTVVVNTVASENPDDAGRYSMDVEQGQYTVTLLVDGYPPSHAGVITVYDDSKPGTLNDFLGAMTEDDVRPEALRRFEAMVEEVARQASEASRNATAAGQATPVQNCTIQLKACRTSTTVVVNTVASENPDDAGRYSMDVEQGQYTVTLLVEGYPPSHAGVITVYDDSKPGTLNDFLGAMTEDDVRPEALRRFEAMVEEVARQASEASRNATAAGQA
ncbi:phage tail protein, partial [Salmonella enterica subsp. enterica serovar Typhimurium]